MQGSDYLLTCAEVAVALAGFSALVVALSERGPQGPPLVSRVLVSSLIERSLFAVFFSLAPLLLAGLELRPSQIWLVCSGSLAAYIASMAWRSSVNRRKDPHFSDVVAGPAFGLLMLVINAVVLMAAAAFVDGFEVDGFGAAFWGALSLSAMNFIIGMLMGAVGLASSVVFGTLGAIFG